MKAVLHDSVNACAERRDGRVALGVVEHLTIDGERGRAGRRATTG